jgi:hypothetical protein
MIYFGLCILWILYPLDFVSPGRCAPWMMRPLDNASLTYGSCYNGADWVRLFQRANAARLSEFLDRLCVVAGREIWRALWDSTAACWSMAALSTPTALSLFSPPMLKRLTVYFLNIVHRGENVAKAGNRWFSCNQLEKNFVKIFFFSPFD